MTSPERPARFSAESLLVPAPGGLDALTALADLAITTYAVDADAVAKHLPSGFEPEIFELGQGQYSALVSAVSFREVGFHFRIFPALKVAFNQINYRAYVLYKGRRVVWFFGNSLATPLYILPRHIWQLSWNYAEIEIETKWTENTCEHYQLIAKESWGQTQLTLKAAGKDSILAGFADEEDAAVILTHPLLGFYRRLDGRVGTYRVWHSRSITEQAFVQNASFPFLQYLGLCKPDAKPHSVLLQKQQDFVIKLPPQIASLVLASV
jgi:hypothetical protein